MAIGWLYFQEMAVISGPWVTEGDPAGVAIEKAPALVALEPQLHQAHSDIVDLRGKDTPQLQALSQQETAVDAKHDAYVKLIYTALTVLADGSANGHELLDLRDTLFPQKLKHMRKSYRGEVGHAVLVAKHPGSTPDVFSHHPPPQRSVYGMVFPDAKSQRIRPFPGFEAIEVPPNLAICGFL